MADPPRSQKLLRSGCIGPGCSAALGFQLPGAGVAVAAHLVAAPWRGDLARASRDRAHRNPASRDYRVGLPIDSRRHPVSRRRLVGITVVCRSTGALAVWPQRTAAVLALVAIACNTSFHAPRTPPDWQAVNTTFGGIAHGNKDPIAEYAAAQWIQEKALNATAKVLIFPETVVPTWTPATDAFWQQTLDQLRSSGKTILVGARLPATMPLVSIELYNFSADLAALRGQPSPVAITQSKLGLRPAPFAYDNALVIRGADTGAFKQRIPVPIGMWNPLKIPAARLNLNASGVIALRGERAAVLICYEQLLTWPVLVSMAQHPTMLIAVANVYWATGTPIATFQLAAVEAWARLFSLPYFSAVNT